MKRSSAALVVAAGLCAILVSRRFLVPPFLHTGVEGNHAPAELLSALRAAEELEIYDLRFAADRASGKRREKPPRLYFALTEEEYAQARKRTLSGSAKDELVFAIERGLELQRKDEKIYDAHISRDFLIRAVDERPMLVLAFEFSAERMGFAHGPLRTTGWVNTRDNARGVLEAMFAP